MQAFELVDSNGQVRAQFDVEESGEVVLRLRDETGAVRVKLGASEDGTAQSFDRAGHTDFGER